MGRSYQYPLHLNKIRRVDWQDFCAFCFSSSFIGIPDSWLHQ